MTEVSVVQNENVRLAVHEAIKLVGGIESVVNHGDTIVIKPNLVTAMPSERGMTTDPFVVKAVIDLCMSMRTSTITIAEGSATCNTKLAFEKAGYYDIIKEYNIKFVDLNTAKTRTVEIPEGKGIKSLEIPTIILESNVLINIPKLKLYRQKWASLTVKNLVGVVNAEGFFTDEKVSKFSLEVSPELWKPDGKGYMPHHGKYFNPRGEKEKIHENLNESIVDLASVVRPSLNVIDGMMICRDPDLTHYNPEILQLNTVLASTDYMAIDSVALQIAGRTPFEIPYLKSAVERGIGESDVSKIQVVGTPIEQITKEWNT
ncbi:MAG: DUF362 domain-containing protein [Candidatus Thorarchaeota archaeon]